MFNQYSSQGGYQQYPFNPLNYCGVSSISSGNGTVYGSVNSSNLLISGNTGSVL
jgi:hypothetical protein